jgi:TolA-binding protein
MTSDCRLKIADWRLSIFALLLVLVFVIDGRAQSIVLKTGQSIETTGVRRDGDMIMGKVQVGAGSGEVGYHLAQIAKIAFPEPRGIKMATELMGQGQPDKALAELEPIIAFYAPLKDVPGAWWSQAALIKVSALAALQRDGDAEALANEIQKTTVDPEVGRAVQLRLAAGLIRKRDFERAIAICDAAIKESTDSTIVANAWINKGDALLAQKQWDSALLAYLHVPVFFSDERTFLPAALLGSARSYRRLDDLERAKRSLNELIAEFPKTAEATTAKSELQKLEK